MRRAVAAAFLVLILTGLLGWPYRRGEASPAAAPILPAEEAYPYHSNRFTQLIEDSDGGRDDVDFYTWMEDAYATSGWRYPGYEQSKLAELLAARRDEMSRLSGATRAEQEIALARWLHQLVKRTIPKFSLDRGFEFSDVVKNGERQCLLQSVLIASLLQEAGVDAGVAMVNRNIAGHYTNNSHVVTLVKLADGRDIITDASDPTPFVRHQGLLVRIGGYRYVAPNYGPNSEIVSYRVVGKGRTVSPARVRPLDFAYVRSQFWYYHGERAPGGVWATGGSRTWEGLTASAHYLQQSVHLCPTNPLAVYMLGRTELALGEETQAHQHLETAAALYRRYGWVPDGVKQALRLAK